MKESPPPVREQSGLHRDLSDPRWIYLKGFLFLGIGLLAGAGLLVENPGLRPALLWVLSVWGFCRFYYFAFYVIEHYVDGEFKFTSLYHFLTYLLRRGSR